MNIKIPKSLTTVTTFSKLIAGILFVALPFVGFVLGMQYQEVTTQPIVKYVTTEKIKTVPQEDSDKTLMKRCGQIPDEVVTNNEYFDAVRGPSWAPDCRHIAWSLRESSIGYEGNDPAVIEELENIPRKLTGREGVFLYTDATKKTTKIYSPKKINETPAFEKWLDRNTIVFTAENNEYKYDINNNELSINELN